MNTLIQLFHRWLDVVESTTDTDHDRDRGDVPGWVMVTLMSALLVVGLLVVFRDQVEALVRSAFASIR